MNNAACVAKDYQHDRISVSEKTNSFLVMISITIAIIPDLNRYFSKIAWIIIILMWYFQTLISYKIKSNRTIVSVLSLLLFVGIAYEILLRIIGFSSAEYGNYFIKLAFVDIVIKSVFVYKSYSIKAKKFLFRYTQIIIIAILIQNIIIEYTDPNIHYYMYFFPENYIGKNVAMTEFYNVLAIFIGIMFFDFKNNKSIFTKVVDFICIFLSYFFMLSYEPRTTALVVSLFFIAVIVFIDEKSMRKKIVLSFVFILIIAIILNLREIIIQLFPERVSNRLNAVSQFSSAYDGNEYLSRFRLFVASLTTYFSSISAFAFGIGLHMGSEFSDMIGQHSFITDSMAAYGSIGLIYLFMVYHYMWKTMILKENFSVQNRCKKASLIVFVLFTVLSNPIKPEIAIAGFLLPSLYYKGDN